LNWFSKRLKRSKKAGYVQGGRSAPYDNTNTIQIASCQSLSGTGALQLAGLAIKRVSTGKTNAYITDPTWSNHELLFHSLGYDVQKLPYYKNGAFDFESYIAVLRVAQPGSVIVLHSCAHNPTGCDPSKSEWQEIASVIQERNLFPIFDSA
jgi:aspartate aminotransferase